jgi:hypothetical protein
MKWLGALAIVIALLIGLALASDDTGPPSGIQVYPAGQILTMDPRNTTATAIAVQDGRILAVGHLQEVLGVVGDAAEEGRRFSQNFLFHPKLRILFAKSFQFGSLVFAH